MALAIHMEQLLRDGRVKDQAELATIAGVTRARVTQVMGLLNLAPAIQEELLEELLFLTIDHRCGKLVDRALRPRVKMDWKNQLGQVTELVEQ
jgi:hypothetical protein